MLTHIRPGIRRGECIDSNRPNYLIAIPCPQYWSQIYWVASLRPNRSDTVANRSGISSKCYWSQNSTLHTWSSLQFTGTNNTVQGSVPSVNHGRYFTIMPYWTRYRPQLFCFWRGKQLKTPNTVIAQYPIYSKTILSHLREEHVGGSHPYKKK